MTIQLRPMLNSDSPGVIDLVRSCMEEKPGCIFDLDGDDADLLAPASSFWKADGQAWVAEAADGRIVGCGGCVPSRKNRWELRRLFVAKDERRKGLGTLLLGYIETAALAGGGKEMDAWTDARFTGGHAFYIHQGYAQTGETRDLYDLAHTVEYHFVKPLESRFQRLRHVAGQSAAS